VEILFLFSTKSQMDQEKKQELMRLAREIWNIHPNERKTIPASNYVFSVCKRILTGIWCDEECSGVEELMFAYALRSRPRTRFVCIDELNMLATIATTSH